MAKKQQQSSSGMSEMMGLLKKVDPDLTVLTDSDDAIIKEWISTGVYILNACLSGSLFGGIADNRCVCFSGDPGTGKSFLALSICRCAQKLGYIPLYCDSEGAINSDFVENLGCDPSQFMIKQVNSIQDFGTFLSKLLNSIEETANSGKTPPKLLLVLDSLGNLASEKEINDSIKGNYVADFTKQKALRSVFRVNGTKLSALRIPFIVTNHTYDVVNAYVPTKEMTGGGGLKFNASVIAMLSKSKLEDKDKIENENKKIEYLSDGIAVTVKPTKQRFARPVKVKFTIPTTRQPNPFVGLEDYISWESCGIVRGTIIETEREYEKLQPADKKMVYLMEKDGVKKWVMPKETARSYVCRHLFDKVPLNALHTRNVFTDEVLRELDENAIKPAFKLPAFDETIYDNDGVIEDGIDYSNIE